MGNRVREAAANETIGSDRLISLTRTDEGRRYFSLDGLRSVVNLTDDAGSAVASYHLDAWGNFRFPTELDSSHNRFAFTGHIFDTETGLYNAKARYFDPKLGRFLTQDSFLGEIHRPPSLHRYLYANANPTRFVDPDGHLAATATGTALGFAWGVGQAIGGFFDDAYHGKTRSAGEYFSVVAQNTIAGAEIGLAVDIGFASGGLAAAPAGALMGAGVSGLTFQGRAQEWSGFAVNQGRGAAIGGTLAAAPMLAIPAAAYGVYTGIQEIRSGAPEVGATTIALSVVPFAFKGVRDAAFGRRPAVPAEAPPTASNGKPAMVAEGSGQGAESTAVKPAIESVPKPAAGAPPGPTAPPAAAPTAPSVPAGETFGPQPPRSPLGRDVVESFPDPEPTVYRNGLRPDTPVVDHIRARALRGHPTDPVNQHTKAWSENARKGWHEGDYLQEKARLVEGGLTPEQAEWVLSDYLRWIETDIHATPVDPAKLDKLRSP